MRTPAIGSGQRYRPGVFLSEDVLGTLWKGTDVRSGSTVTIRLLDERLVSDPQAVHRAIARLRWAQFEARNPHLARVLDHGLRLGGRPAFVVSEGFTGETLSQHLDRGDALSLRRAIEVFAAVAEGLASAHAAWIYHGSLTAASILMDDRVVAKVVDVGLGELLLDDSGNRQRTVRAMRFEDQEATDVLAVARLLNDVVSRRPRQPGMATEGASEIEISPELSDLIHRALSPHRLHRPSMAELAAALASDQEAASSPQATRYDDLPSPPEDDRVQEVPVGEASDESPSESLVTQVTPLVAPAAPVEPPPVEPPRAEPPRAEPPRAEPPPVEPPPVEPPPVEPPPVEAPPVEAPPVEAPPVEAPPVEPPRLEPITEPPVLRPPSLEPPLREPAVAESSLAQTAPAEALPADAAPAGALPDDAAPAGARPTKRPTKRSKTKGPPKKRPQAKRQPTKRPPTKRSSLEEATQPAKRFRLAGPRLPVVLGASVIALGLIVGGFIASRGNDADQRGDHVRPTVTPSAISEPPSPEPVVPATVPSLLGQPLESATSLLERAGLVVGSVTPVLGEEGVVVRSDPTQGEAVPAGSVVDLFVGNGAG